MAIQKDYYTPIEALSILKENDINFNTKDLHYFGKKNKLIFSLIIDSRPAFVIQYDSASKQNRCIGLCLVYGIARLPQDGFISLISVLNAQADHKYTTKSFDFDFFFEQPYIVDWNINSLKAILDKSPSLAKKISILECYFPLPYSDDIKIDKFIFDPTIFSTLIKQLKEIMLIKDGLDDHYEILREKNARAQIFFDESNLCILHVDLMNFIKEFNIDTKLNNSPPAPMLKKYSTTLMDLQTKAIEEFWRDLKPDDPKPERTRIISWLQKKGASERQAIAIDMIIRPDQLRKGGKKKAKD